MRNEPDQYTRFRDDGWPFCPCCDEDELYSLAIPATVATIVCCYRCGWRPARAYTPVTGQFPTQPLSS
jgi:hypothetical protein